MMSRTAKLLAQLESGKAVTAKQISGWYGLKNPHDAIYQLRNSGFNIKGNRATLSDGTSTMRYTLATKPAKAKR